MQSLLSIRHVNLGLVDTYDVAYLLLPLRSTLESVSFRCAAGYHRVKFHDAWRWPHVLHLNLYMFHPIRLDLARAFPNIREVHVDRTEPDVISVSATSHRECWSQLDYVEGPMSALYMLGLTSSIRELHITKPLTHSEPQRPTAGCIRRTDGFLDLVRVASPVALSFAVDLRSKLADWRFFEALAHAAPMLTFLAMRIPLTPKVFYDLVSTIKFRFCSNTSY
jgi:hypothetical protein